MARWVTPNVLQKQIRLGDIDIPEKFRGRKLKKRKFPSDSVWNLPAQNEHLWETVPVEDELFQIAHYMDRNKSYRSDNEYPCFQPLETTYGKMNEWMKSPGGRDMRSGVPVTMSDGNWTQATQVDNSHHRFKNDDYNARFRDSYADLTSKIAYRFPNPGLPRLRQGRIGGSWRHIKEVLGHGGSRVCYVDGLVSVYDEENFNQDLQAQSPYRPHLRRTLYSANRGFDDEAARLGRQGVQFPVVEELPMLSGAERSRKLALQSPNKSKGVYSYSRVCN